MMPPSIKAIVFDIDGTLLDTSDFIFHAFEHVFQSYKLPLTRADVLRVMGKPLEECFALLAPDHDSAALSSAHRDFQENNLQLVRPYPHTLETLQKLKAMGVKLATASTRKRTGLQSLKHTGIFDQLDVILTGDDVKQFKPHPESIFKALEKFTVEPAQAAMVGDAGVDIEAGKRAGTVTIASAYGFATRQQLETFHPDYIIEDIAEIPAIVTTEPASVRKF